MNKNLLWWLFGIFGVLTILDFLLTYVVLNFFDLRFEMNIIVFSKSMLFLIPLFAIGVFWWLIHKYESHPDSYRFLYIVCLVLGVCLSGFAVWNNALYLKNNNFLELLQGDSEIQKVDDTHYGYVSKANPDQVTIIDVPTEEKKQSISKILFAIKLLPIIFCQTCYLIKKKVEEK